MPSAHCSWNHDCPVRASFGCCYYYFDLGCESPYHPRGSGIRLCDVARYTVSLALGGWFRCGWVEFAWDDRFSHFQVDDYGTSAPHPDSRGLCDRLVLDPSLVGSIVHSYLDIVSEAHTNLRARLSSHMIFPMFSEI